MGRHKSKAERGELGARAVYLRDVQKLKWKIITERLGISSLTLTRIYYEKAKVLRGVEEEAALAEKADALAVPSELSFEQVEALAERIKVSVGWVWLYENGFKHRVPEEIREKIEDGKLCFPVEESNLEEDIEDVEIKEEEAADFLCLR